MSTPAPVAPPRLRIAVLNRQFCATGGGAERYSIALVEQLAARHEIHVFAQHIEHSWPGVTYHRVSKPLNRPRWVNQLWYATRTWWATRTGFDVVHSHENCWHGNVQTVHVVPVRFNLLHGLSTWPLLVRWLKIITSPRLLVYLALEAARFSQHGPRAVVVTAPIMLPAMRQAYPRCHPTVLTPGVERVVGRASAAQKAAARAQLGLPAEGFCILLVGNDYRKKGLGCLIEALAQLPLSCCVAVVGNPAQRAHFTTQARAAGVEQRVFFLASLPDVGVAYQACDCLAHPTLEDTFAMVVLEAMAHGLPVLVSGEKYCGIAGLLQHERNALLLADPRDAAALTSALRRLLQEPDLVAALRQAGLEFARQYLWQSLALQQESLYLALTKYGDPRVCDRQ